MPARADLQLLAMNKLSEVEYNGSRFVIMDCPSPDNVTPYAHCLKLLGVSHVVRLCEPTYDPMPYLEEGIAFHELVFKDGQAPPESIINKWIDIFNEVEASPDVVVTDSNGEQVTKRPALAVHCVAGLGRAPVMVAMALIEKGMKPLDSIDLVRNKRKGAFNSRQIQFIDAYKKRSTFSNTLRRNFTKMFKRKQSPAPSQTAITAV